MPRIQVTTVSQPVVLAEPRLAHYVRLARLGPFLIHAEMKRLFLILGAPHETICIDLLSWQGPPGHTGS